jgi:hypothetical protein
MKAWLKGGVIGVAFVVIILILSLILSLFSHYLVFGSGEYGEWNGCANSVNYRWTYSEGSYYFDDEFVTIVAAEDIGQKQQEKIFELCGDAPVMPYQTLRAVSKEMEHLFLKGELVPVFLFADTPIAVILAGFVVGVIVGSIANKVKRKWHA